MSANRLCRCIHLAAVFASLFVITTTAAAKSTYLLPTDLFGVSRIGSAVWVCGANGTILHSSDGKAWEVQESGVDENLSGIFFVNPRKGFCVGYHGTVLKTEDGGGRWVKVAVDSAYYLTDVFFVSERAGFIVGEFGTVLSTVDGGSTWRRVRPGGGEMDVILNDVDFFEGVLGFVVGEFGTVLRTTDGGRTWRQVDVGAGEYMLFGVEVVDGRRVVITGADGLVLLSENGGRSFRKVDLGVRNQVFGVHFSGPGDGYVYGKNVIFRSGDGGRSFGKVDVGESLSHGWIYAMSQGLAVGNGGQIYRLADGKWTRQRVVGTMNVSGGVR